MKKLFIFAAALFVITQASAQTRFGVKGGLNLANITVKSQLGSSSTSSRASFHLGVIADFALGDVAFLQPGLMLNSKGAKASSGDGKLVLNYLEIPVNIGARFEIADNVKLYGMAGPYFAFGISGKSKGNGSDESVKWGSGDDADVKRLDIGLNIGAGVEVSNFLIGIQYGLGLSNIAAQGDSNNSIKNKVFGISVGYLFGGE
jgi:Outer membrane protein beta-barrel domain